MSVCARCGVGNPDGFRFCGSCGAALAPPAAASALAERRKTATLLFCDVTGSTALGERVETEVLREVMLRYFDEMRTAIERHSGVVEKFVGDAVMAVFGVPTAHADDALRAVRAAAEMLERLEALNDDVEGRLGSRIAARIGVNTGEVVAGDPAAGETFVSGDPVNVAARLEQSAGAGEVLLGELTYRLVRSAVTVEPVDPLELKGKSERVAAYRLLAVSPDGAAPAARPAGALVGRGGELETLRRELRTAVEERSCRLVTVLGEAGVGKSRLVREFVDGAEANARVLVGRCLAYGEGITYWALGEIVRSAAGVTKHDPIPAARAKIEALLAGVEDGDVAAGFLVQAIGLESGGGATGEIAWAARRLFERVASERPLVVVIEDLHWAEDALLELVAQLPSLAQGSILVLCLARSGRVEEREWPAEILRLQPLADEETTALIETLIGGARLEDEARSRVLEAAAGIPLFVEELLALLVEEGLVREGQDGEWVATKSLAEFTIPPSIDALLAERLDRLGARERVLLEDGAVEGQLFHLGALLALAAEALERAVALLADLVERELVQPASASFADETAYRFRHILIRDAAYRALPKKARAELHERYALWLETKVGQRMTGYEEILGYHFEQAYRYRAELGLRGDAHAERGGRLLAAAGHRALARSDMAAAEGLLSRAAELLPREDPERVELLLGLSVALRDLAAFDRAAAVNREAMELAAATGLRGVEARGRMNGAFLRLYTDPARSHELVAAAEEALPVCEELGDDLGLAQALWFIGVAEWNRGRARRARELAERALRHAEGADDRHMRDQALSLVAISVLFGPTPVEQALERCRSLHEGARSARGTAAVMMSYTAVLEAMRGRFDVAREQAARSVAMLEDVGRRMTAAGARYFAARVELLADEPGRAEEVARAGLVTLDAAGETANSPVLRALLAEALCRQGRFSEAEAQAEASEQKAWPDDIRAQVGARAARAQALAAQGHCDRGGELAREALARLEHAEDIDLRAATLVALAATLSGTERDDARRSALELYERKGNLAAAARVRESLVAS